MFNAQLTLKAHSDGRKLEVKFRPDDKFCKPAMSKTVKGTNLILRVKRKKGGEPGVSCNNRASKENSKCKYSLELIGVANKIYQFSGDKIALPSYSGHFFVCTFHDALFCIYLKREGCVCVCVYLSTLK